MAPDGTLEDLLQLLHSDNRQQVDDARAALITHASGRLEELTRRMLRRETRLHRWEDTGDVLQNALLRLHRALETVRPDSARDFFALAAQQIRRELIDLARHHFGPLGEAGHHHTDTPRLYGDREAPSTVAVEEDRASGPQSLMEWTEFHQAVERLPPDLREVFHLLWYQGLQQAEAASLLHVTTRTIKNRWRAAKLALQEALQREPEADAPPSYRH